MIKDVTDLDVYNLSLELLGKLYALANQIPDRHRRMKYQLTDAGEKIAPIIAEGFAEKRSPREFCRYLSMALGSSDEVITHIREVEIVAKTFKNIDIELCDQLIDEYKKLSKKLNKLLAVWKNFN